MSAPFRLGPPPAPQTRESRIAQLERVRLGCLVMAGRYEEEAARPFIMPGDSARLTSVGLSYQVAADEAKAELDELSLDLDTVKRQLEEESQRALSEKKRAARLKKQERRRQ